jgi:hypothetical protein
VFGKLEVFGKKAEAILFHAQLAIAPNLGTSLIEVLLNLGMMNLRVSLFYALQDTRKVLHGAEST